MNDAACDVIIIGGGPAGLTSGIYTAREMLNTLLLEKGLCGGLPINTDLIENYPGFPEGIKGAELMDKFKRQAENSGVQIHEFEEIEKIGPKGEKIFVQTNKQKYTTSAAIIASGSIPRKLGIPGEEKFFGKGLSYCATCDAPLYKDKDVVVVGGGDAAAEEALFLSKFARRVTLVHRRYELRAARILGEQLEKNKKVNLLLNHILVSINGQERVSSVVVKDLAASKERTLEVSGIFMYVGFSPNSQFVSGIVKLDDLGYIKTREDMRTDVSGIYAVGDVRAKRVRQIDTACGDATIAAISVRDYIKREEK